MTITSSRYVDPGLSSSLAETRLSPKPPPRIWQAAESPFRGYQPPPSDGYAQTTRDTAIIIDNGSVCAAGFILVICSQSTQGQVFFEPDGRLTNRHDFRSQQRSHATETVNTIGRSHMLVTMHSPMPRQEGRFEMLLSPEAVWWATGTSWKAYWITPSSALA